MVNLGRYEDAIKYYNKALQINPRYENAWYNKGAALYGIGKYNEAMECFDKTLEINPRNEFAIESKEIVLSLLRRK